jgi:hypothetical protein
MERNHLLVPNVKKIRGLNLPDPHGPVQVCSGTAFLFAFTGKEDSSCFPHFLTDHAACAVMYVNVSVSSHCCLQ